MERPEPPAEEGAPEWMVTFSDLTTLLLTFFILLLSFANMDIVKFREMLGSVKDAFGVQVKRKEAEYVAFSPTPYEKKSALTQKEEFVLGMILEIKSLFESDKKTKGNVEVEAERDGVLLRVGNSIMFKPGSAELLPQAYPILDKIVKILEENNVDLKVMGHTDDIPVKGSIYPSNWELSAARAAAVVRYIISHSKAIKPTRLQAIGLADTRPLVPNISPENRAKNRRVEFYFYRPKI